MGPGLEVSISTRICRNTTAHQPLLHATALSLHLCCMHEIWHDRAWTAFVFRYEQACRNRENFFRLLQLRIRYSRASTFSGKTIRFRISFTSLPAACSIASAVSAATASVDHSAMPCHACQQIAMKAAWLRLCALAGRVPQVATPS